MIGLSIHLEGDNCWPDLKDRPDDVIHLQTFEVAGLAGGMASGAPSVSLRLDLPPSPAWPKGRIVIAETSLALFLSAAQALKARYGDPREDRL